MTETTEANSVPREEIVLDRMMPAIKAGDRAAALFVLKSALDAAASKGWVEGWIND